MKSVLFRRCVAASVVLGMLVACSEDEAQFKVRFAPEYPKTPPTVSILGLFRDGRMNAETWEEVGPKLSSPFGSPKCAIGYDKDFASKKEDLANSIDDFARENGLTDELLEKLSPEAVGDEVLVFTMSGRPSAQNFDGGGGNGGMPPSTPNSQPGMRGGGARRGHTVGMGPMRQPDRNVFEVSASLYSTRDHHSVGLVAMDYTGSSAAEAIDKFVAKLRQSLPGSTCTGWHWDGKLDAKAIDDLREKAEKEE